MLRALEIMAHFDPLMWVIENPATGLLKTRPFMGGRHLLQVRDSVQSEASLEIPWEPRAFSKGQRPSVTFATDECEALLGAGRDRSGRAAGGRIRARLRRKAHARGRASAAAALCEAIARRRLDAESQAAGPRALLERRRHVCGPPRRAGSLRRAR